MLSRSYKYRRPRGLLTADFLDPGCLVQVGDEPNVRAAHRLVEAGMDVRAQNAWPSLRFDLKAVNGLAGRWGPGIRPGGSAPGLRRNVVVSVHARRTATPALNGEQIERPPRHFLMCRACVHRVFSTSGGYSAIPRRRASKVIPSLAA